MDGGVAQMVERSLSMWEVRGSIPRVSRKLFCKCTDFSILPCRTHSESPRGMSMPWGMKKEKKILHRPGIEPGPPAWQASILPLNQRCWLLDGCNSCLDICFCAKVILDLNATKMSLSQSVGFEPTLPEGNWFLVSRLNHSATTAWCSRYH